VTCLLAFLDDAVARSAAHGVAERHEDLVWSWGIIDRHGNGVHVVEHPDVVSVGERHGEPEPGTRHDLGRRDDGGATADRRAHRGTEGRMDESCGMFEFTVESDDGPFAVRGDVVGDCTEHPEAPTGELPGQPRRGENEGAKVVDVTPGVRIPDHGRGDGST